MKQVWYGGITVAVLLLVVDAVVVQMRLRDMDITQLKADMAQVKEDVATWRNWQKEGAEATPLPTATPVPGELKETTKPQASAGAGALREIYIPLGSGSTRNPEWTDAGGQSYIDTRQYKIKEAYFEASLRSNSGQVGARLINKNEGDYVVGSEISLNTSASTLIRSSKIFLPAGNKLYGIQLRSETQQEVFIDNAKVRLVVE